MTITDVGLGHILDNLMDDMPEDWESGPDVPDIYVVMVWSGDEVSNRIVLERFPRPGESYTWRFTVNREVDGNWELQIIVYGVPYWHTHFYDQRFKAGDVLNLRMHFQ